MGSEGRGGANVIHAVHLPCWLWKCVIIIFLVVDSAFIQWMCIRHTCSNRHLVRFSKNLSYYFYNFYFRCGNCNPRCRAPNTITRYTQPLRRELWQTGYDKDGHAGSLEEPLLCHIVLSFTAWGVALELPAEQELGYCMPSVNSNGKPICANKIVQFIHPFAKKKKNRVILICFQAIIESMIL